MARIGTFYANPYSALDAEGRPAGLYPLDPDLAGGHRRYIGGDIDPTKTVITKVADPANGVAGRQTTVMQFWGTPVNLPITQHHARGVLSGDLIAGDKETALACGLPADQWVEPQEALAKSKEAAITRWTAAYGKPPALIDEGAKEHDRGRGSTLAKKEPR